MALGTLCTLVQSVHCAKAQHWQGDRGSGADIQATPPTKTHSLFNPNNRGTEAQLSFHCPPQTAHMALRPSAACGPWDLLSLLAHCVGKAFSLGAESRPTFLMVPTMEALMIGRRDGLDPKVASGQIQVWHPLVRPHRASFSALRPQSRSWMPYNT